MSSLLEAKKNDAAPPALLRATSANGRDPALSPLVSCPLPLPLVAERSDAACYHLIYVFWATWFALDLEGKDMQIQVCYLMIFFLLSLPLFCSPLLPAVVYWIPLHRLSQEALGLWQILGMPNLCWHGRQTRW